MLKLINIDKTFDPGTAYANKVIDKLSLQVNDGEFITIVGSNGSGKSTLLSLIAGSIMPDKGKIILDDQDITMEKQHIRAHYIGRLFQDPMIGTAPGLSVYQNLMLAAKQGKWLEISGRKDREYLQMRLRELGMGLEERMDIPVRLLSGGQRQALTLIMATINPPKILLLDEHTAALDPNSATKVIEITRDIVEKYSITCLMVTHDMNQALQMGDRTLMLDKGKIIYDVSGKQRRSLTVEKMIDNFRKVSANDLDDRVLLNT